MPLGIGYFDLDTGRINRKERRSMSTPEILAEPGKTADASQVGLVERFAYGSGNFASQMIFNPATAFIVYFYTDIAGIAAGAVGTLLLVSRLFDLLNPVMGLLVDRTNT